MEPRHAVTLELVFPNDMSQEDIHKAVEAAMNLWPSFGITDKEHGKYDVIYTLAGSGDLSAWETEEAFAGHLSHVVWEAAGRCIGMTMNTACVRSS